MEFCRLVDEEHLQTILRLPVFSILSNAPKLLPRRNKREKDDDVLESAFVVAVAGTSGAAVLLLQRFPYDTSPLSLSGLSPHQKKNGRQTRQQRWRSCGLWRPIKQKWAL